ncbi:sulfite exporter TauE/SafE family protein [Evansella cellulosilytica]|uniref:Probable membrane transporter protein n=1 Tax=Evansella cellulosilytica (strain ATCC 21833 / DSM 2522 / FERM P-1141 / JCM 9156 / N-4) TaxID=649639 RepID=E6TWA1_EVAC2|nr:sulfite exporter TauE/SafE family protein [Evansella cellulosilytica]ADU31057.1 protein of unknown function DUF81 [Evansella cellulosilytica DSM 2522]
MIVEWGFIFIIILIGGFVQGASGFGFGLVAMGFLPLILTLKDSTLIVITLLLISALSIIFKIYQYIDGKGLLVILIPAIFGRIAAFFVLSTYGEMDILKTYLGLFLIGMVFYLLLNSRKAAPTTPMKPYVPVVLGLLGGFIGGVFAVGGPFFVFYFLLRYKEKHKYNANMQATVVVTSLLTLVLHGMNGDFHSAMAIYFFIGTIAVYIGTMVGLRWFEKLPSSLIKRFAIVLVAIAAINLIFSS